MHLNRRRFIATAALAPIAGAGEAEPEDPLVPLIAEWRHRISETKEATTDEEVDRRFDARLEMEKQICEARPITLEGLRSQGEFIRIEMTENGFLSNDLDCAIDNFFNALNELTA